MWHTYGTWLPGSPRGFRNRNHRIHSSGDYRSPPPPGEHEGLFRYNVARSKGEVVLRDSKQRDDVRDAIVGTLEQLKMRSLVVSVTRVHIHLVAELPVRKIELDTVITKLKIESSKLIKCKVNGRGWARGRTAVLIRDPKQRRAAFFYVKYKQGSSASVWHYNMITPVTLQRSC